MEVIDGVRKGCKLYTFDGHFYTKNKERNGEWAHFLCGTIPVELDIGSVY